MTYEEKRAWVYALVTAVVPAVYFVTILGRLSDTEPAQVSYMAPLLTATGVAIVANMLGNMLIGPPGKVHRDERDAAIHRRGTNVGYFILALGAVGALLLAVAEYPHFWIAHVLYLAFVLDALLSSIVKIVAYRRGF